jgi:hypothetical protein
LLQIISRNDEVGGFHFGDPGCLRAVIFALTDDRFATATLFKTALGCLKQRSLFSVRGQVPARMRPAA